LTRPSLSAAEQARLRKIFEHAAAKTPATCQDFDHVLDLLDQCVAGEPGNVNYVRAYVETLQKKYHDNGKGSTLAQFKERGLRNALKTALEQQHWEEAIQHGLKILCVNPWDVPTLTALVMAAKKLGYAECETYYLRCAIRANPDDPETNRLCAMAATDRGLLDQAIAFWHRVEKAWPGDEKVKQSISTLVVQRAWSPDELSQGDAMSRKLYLQAQQQVKLSQENTLLQSIEQEPEKLANYLELSQLYLNQQRYGECEDILARAYAVSGRDADVRDKWEDAQLRHLRQQIAQTSDPDVEKELRQAYFQKDLETYQNRVERHPTNLLYRYELGRRYLMAKRYTEAIGELQVAQKEPNRKGRVLLALGQSFQQIRQYRLAMSHYESAIEEIPDRDVEDKKRVLYAAGRLALALKNLDTAENHLTALAGLDFSYRDVWAMLKKIAKLRQNSASVLAQDENGSSQGAG
jgi:tetratricopeptide (TPR) repeat protein